MSVSNKPNMRIEMQRRRSQSARILDLLKSGDEVTTLNLARIAFDYTARVSELRKEGHVILAEYEKPGVFRYSYLGQKDEE